MKNASKSQSAKIQISTLRSKIDQIDSEILKLLKNRFKCSDKIGEIKRKNKLPIVSRERESLLLEKLVHKSKQLKVSQKLILKIYKNILSASRSAQRNMNDGFDTKPKKMLK